MRSDSVYPPKIPRGVHRLARRHCCRTGQDQQICFAALIFCALRP